MQDHPVPPFPHYGEEQAAKARKIKLLRIFGGVVFFTYAIPICSWIVLDHVADHQLKRSLRGLERAGYPGDPKATVPAPVPSIDNGAPLYEAACKMIQGATQEIDVIGYGLWGLFDPGQRRQAQAVLERHREAFDLARRARQKPYCRFDRNENSGRKDWWPDYQWFTGLAEALGHRAEAQVEEGRSEEARETIRDLWGLVFAVGDAPPGTTQSLLPLLGSRAVESTVRCSRSATTEEEWRQWGARLPDAAAFRMAMFLQLRGDLVFWSEDARKGHPYALEHVFGNGSGDSAIGRVLRPLLKFESAKGLRGLQKTLARWEKSPSSLHEELLARDEDEGLNLPLIYLSSGFPYSTLRRLAVLQSAVAVARGGMECERIWSVEGRYPETLREEDPMTGRPLEFSLDRTSLSSRPPQGRVTVSHDPEADGLVWNLLHVGD